MKHPSAAIFSRGSGIISEATEHSMKSCCCTTAHRALRVAPAGQNKFLLHHKMFNCLKFELNNIKRTAAGQANNHKEAGRLALKQYVED